MQTERWDFPKDNRSLSNKCKKLWRGIFTSQMPGFITNKHDPARH